MALTKGERLARLNSPEAKAKMKETINSPEYQEQRKEKRERIKNFNKLARYMMEAEIPDGDAALDELHAHGFYQGDYQSAVFLGQLKRAMNGDPESAKFCRDTAGYKPTETLNLGNADDKPFEAIDLSKLSTEELKKMVMARQPLYTTEE